MKFLSVSLARLTILADTAQLNPRNQVSPPDMAKAITERYSFLKFPKAIEDFDLAKGISFGFGKLRNINITALNIYNVGSVIDTGSSTNDCDAIHEDIIEWVMKLVGIDQRPGPSRKFYLSEVAFQSDLKLAALNKWFTALSSRIGKVVSEHSRQSFNFEPTFIGAMPDMANVKIGPASFRLDRLLNAPFEDNKYFSSAPVPTDEHIKLLEEFEKVIGG